MATISKTDLIRGAGWSARENEQLVRILFLDNFTSDPSTEKVKFIMEARAALIAAGFVRGSVYSSDYAFLKYDGAELQAVGGSACVAKIFYKNVVSPFPGGTGLQLVEQGSVEGTVTTSFIPGSSRVPIQLSLEDSSDPKNNIEKRGAEMTVRRNMRYIRMVRLLDGTPDDVDSSLSNVEDTVNNATWRGRVKGSWLLNQCVVQYATVPGYYTVHLQAIAQKGQTWAQFVRLRSRFTGDWAVVDPAHVTALLAKEYAYGYIGTDIADYDKKGVLLVGPYDLENFASIFGF